MTLALTIFLYWILVSSVAFLIWMAGYAFIQWRRHRRPFRRLGYLDLTVRRRRD